jgi:hypothetical protein
MLRHGKIVAGAVGKLRSDETRHFDGGHPDRGSNDRNRLSKMTQNGTV